MLQGKPRVPAWVRLDSQTPVEIQLRRGASQWREVLYEKFKKPWKARLRGAR